MAAASRRTFSLSLFKAGIQGPNAPPRQQKAGVIGLILSMCRSGMSIFLVPNPRGDRSR